MQTAVFIQRGLAAAHSKYFIIDSERLVITGDNVYKCTDFTSDCWMDAGYSLHGPVARILRNDFQHFWNQSESCSKTWSSFVNDQQDTVVPIIQELNTFPIIILARLPRNSLPNWTAEMLRNPADQGYLAVLYNAQHSIDIISPSCSALPFQQALIHALSRGIRVRLLLSKMLGKKINAQNLPFQGGSCSVVLRRLCQLHPELTDRALKSEQLQVRWYAQKSAASNQFETIVHSNHSKLLLADGMLAIVGSSNIDTQNWRHSGEMNLLLDDEEVTSRIQHDVFDVQWSTSIPVKEFAFSMEYPLVTALFTLPVILIVVLVLWCISKRYGKDRETMMLSLAVIVLLFIICSQSCQTRHHFLYPWPTTGNMK
jgi:phosphatidylserine/phosphatidylglycerophosphate/cardiolipin synthase-like enzyme